MNEINEIKNEIKENPLPPGFTPVLEEDLKKEDSIFEIYKSDNYKKIFPELIHKIDQKIYHNQSSEDYPFFTENNKIKFLPRLNSPSELLTNNHLKELHIYFQYFLKSISISFNKYLLNFYSSLNPQISKLTILNCSPPFNGLFL